MKLVKLKTVLLVAVVASVLLGLCSCSSDPLAHGIPNFAQVGPGVWRGGQPNA